MKNELVFVFKGINLNAVALSHGWVNLPPFRRHGRAIEYAFSLGSGRTFEITLAGRRNTVTAMVRGSLAAKPDAGLLAAHLRRVLSADFDLERFCRESEAKGEFTLLALAQKGWGRMLRAATPWEDAVKTLCTTNASWPHTVKMCQGIIDAAGAKASSGRVAFPHPNEVIRAFDEKEHIAGLGYRNEYLRQLARHAAGQDAWLLAPLVNMSFAQLLQRVGRWRGFGPYATSHMMMLLGDHSHLPVDREVARTIGVHSPGDRFRPKETAHFADWGEFRFTAYKLHRIAKRMNWIGD